MDTDTSTGLRTNGDRLWQSIMDMAQIGATSRGGSNRQTLTDEDRQGRDLFVNWCKDANCDVRVDQMGNIFAKRPGSEANSPAVIAGSHLDTQPTGGKFDGVYGVLAGLEVIRTLNEAEVHTKHDIEAVCWTNEEGARFAPAMIGSGVWAGEFTLDYGHERTDKAGRVLRDELERIGYLGEQPCQNYPIRAAFEAHIEQGPILENERHQIGIVTGVQGIRWYDLVIEGQTSHAGPTPMHLRRDPVMALAKIVDRLYELIEAHKPWARVTFGDIRTEPGSRNTVPERVTVTVDIRHPQQLTLDKLDKTFREIVNTECNARGLSGDVPWEWHSPAVAFSDACINAVQSAAEMLGYKHMRMVSGAGHDSVYVSRVAPTSMIFVPCEGGISHNETESVTATDLEAGCNVLLHSMLACALV